MRIISGQFKGRTIATPDPRTSHARPTSDRIKEMLFDILDHRGAVSDAVVLDMFAGSGSLGIEALSRGAKEVVFVDMDSACTSLVRQNLRSLGLTAQVFNVDFRFAVRKLAKLGRKFDLIIVDPPYQLDFLQPVMRALSEHDILSPSGLIAVEHSSAEPLPDLPKFDVQTRRSGMTSLSLLTVQDPTKGEAP